MLSMMQASFLSCWICECRAAPVRSAAATPPSPPTGAGTASSGTFPAGAPPSVQPHLRREQQRRQHWRHRLIRLVRRRPEQHRHGVGAERAQRLPRGLRAAEAAKQRARRRRRRHRRRFPPAATADGSPPPPPPPTPSPAAATAARAASRRPPARPVSFDAHIAQRADELCGSGLVRLGPRDARRTRRLCRRRHAGYRKCCRRRCRPLGAVSAATG